MVEHSERKLRLQKQITSQENDWMRNLYKGTNYKTVEQNINLNYVEIQQATAKEKLSKIKEYGKLIKSQFIEKD